MPTEIKKQLVQSLRDKIKKSKSITFAEYHGISASNISKLRQNIKSAGAEMFVSKNTLLKIALKEENISLKKAVENLNGPVATFFAYDDAISPLKVLYNFAKEEGGLPKVKTSIIDGIFNSAEQVAIIGQLPSRNELIAQVAGRMKSPINGIVNLLVNPIKNLVTVLNKVSKLERGEVS